MAGKWNCGDSVELIREIKPHYVTAWRRWRERFLAKVPELCRLGFDDRFLHMWELYLASCEARLATRYIGDVQVILGRPFEPRPMSA